MSAALILFAKSPRVGAVKTRLIPELGAERATAIYEQLLQRNIGLAEHAKVDLRIVYTFAEHDKRYFQPRENWHLIQQCEGSIGERMRYAMDATLKKYTSVILMGADVADIQATDIARAFDLLDAGFDTVLGPSFDGGYWLIGAKRKIDFAFHEINWSTARVFSQTRARIRNAGITLSVLPVRHDVDEPSDLRFCDFLLD